MASKWPERKEPLPGAARRSVATPRDDGTVELSAFRSAEAYISNMDRAGKFGAENRDEPGQGGRRLTDATDERQDDMGGAVRVQASESPARPTHGEKGLHDRDIGPSLETPALEHRRGHTVVQIL